MNSQEIRKWGEQVGHLSPSGYVPLDREFDFSLRVIQIQATLEVAAQLADLRKSLEEATSNAKS